MTDIFRILVAGHNGQVARALAAQAKPGNVELTTLGRADMDIRSKASVQATFEKIKPHMTINAAAFTAVDQAETEAETAHAANAHGARLLAEASAERDTPILHLSTDYVFDGTKSAPYVETDPVAPLGVYGASKLAGETAVTDANPKHFIFRTAWVFSTFGKNFVKTMIRLAETNEEIRVVADQFGNPTSALDIAHSLLDIAHQVKSNPDHFPSGIYHMTGQGETDWSALATLVQNESKRLGGPSARIVPITSAEYPTPVTRPANSRLDCTKLHSTFGVRLPDWQNSVRNCVEHLIKTKGWVQ